MTRHLLLALLLIPSLLSSSRAAGEECLIEGAEGSQVTGKLEYVSFNHPGRPDTQVSGYKLILQKARCYDFQSPETGKTERNNQVSEIAIAGWAEWANVLKANTGNLVRVTGRMQTNLTAYVVAVPQIQPKEITLCNATPDPGKC